MNIQPRVRFQAQAFAPKTGEWWDRSGPEKTMECAKENLCGSKIWKTRIVKQTTTFEVVEEMEPSK